MNIEKKQRFIVNFIYFGIICLSILGLAKIGIPLLAPFIIAFCVVYSLKGTMDYFSSKLHIHRKVVSFFVLALFYSTVGGICVISGLKLFAGFKELILALPTIYTQSIQPAMLRIMGAIGSYTQDIITPEITQKVTSEVAAMVSGVSMKAIEAISGVASSIPEVFIASLLSIISSFFIAADYYDITNFATRKIPSKYIETILDIKNYVSGTLLKYARSYLLIMFITFLEISFGMWVLGVSNFATIGVVIAIFDIAPVLGSGGILVPWLIIEAVQGNFPLAIGLGLLYIIITVIRNIIEPKIIGQQIGLHPLVTLVGMFVGLKLFGIVGMLLLPITVVILKNLSDNGKIQIFK